MKQIRCIRAIKGMDTKKLRVAAYARISHSDLLQSLSNQISYYNQLIQSNSNWEFKGVYVDQAISGRSGQHRKEYQRLIKDCKNGEIDVVLTKSISRFGRNTIELLETIRQLKHLNVSIRFEKENIDTLTTEGEMLITLLASVAEEESSAISQNVRWVVKNKFEQGLPFRPQPIYGYRWNEEQKKYVVEKREAKIVQQIFDWYLEGQTPTQISTRLNNLDETTRLGNPFKRSTIHQFFSQEAYTGKLILQKTYRVGYKGRSIPNKGERTRYIVENAHEAIITTEKFEEVQSIKKERSLHRRKKGDSHE